MGKKVWVLLPLVGILLGCASAPTFTLKNGQTIKAEKLIQETTSTYVIKEKGTGRRTVLPKSLVTNIQGLKK